jgi:hypothetical protein
MPAASLPLVSQFIFTKLKSRITPIKKIIEVNV